MPFLTSFRLSHALVSGAAVVLLLAAAPAAQAFTFQNETGAAAAQDQSFLYPDKSSAPQADQSQTRFESHDGVSTLKDGPFYLRFGHEQSFDQRYNPNKFFDPLGHPN